MVRERKATKAFTSVAAVFLYLLSISPRLIFLLEPAGLLKLCRTVLLFSSSSVARVWALGDIIVFINSQLSNCAALAAGENVFSFLSSPLLEEEEGN